MHSDAHEVMPANNPRTSSNDRKNRFGRNGVRFLCCEHAQLAKTWQDAQKQKSDPPMTDAQKSDNPTKPPMTRREFLTRALELHTKMGFTEGLLDDVTVKDLLGLPEPLNYVR